MAFENVKDPLGTVRGFSMQEGAVSLPLEAFEMLGYGETSSLKHEWTCSLKDIV